MADATTLTPAPTANKPVMVFRTRDLSATIFPNRMMIRDREVTFHKVTLQRTYKDSDDFKSTSSLGRHDLPIAQLLLHQAWEWILDEEAKQKTAKS